MARIRFLTAIFSGLILSACAGGIVPASNPPSFNPEAIEYDVAGNCYGRDVTPAVIETVTEHVMVQPAQVTSDGEVTSPAVFRTITRQAILRERREVVFETVCPQVLTHEFVASLQRALRTRGTYTGPINGILDTPTQKAIQAYQRQEGYDSSLLDIRTARDFGLVAITAEDLQN